ncbi:LOW QUALITY PROTEIN: hypothetical protein TorRG33x02_223890 [Trema orientale]|uniref:Uncharacterized protein n=1 Tax=Trema orientale TaxID=63057 RepID=A0A2P5E8B2_TREOI|nr:LOW QUALITY PROTEIN: hypothetical protein TorRG33x02_223890 [Trema orientale]
MVYNVLWPINMEVVKTIPLSIRDREDKMIWHYKENGSYTVRSGYNLLLRKFINKIDPSCFSLSQWWNEETFELQERFHAQKISRKVLRNGRPRLEETDKVPINPWCVYCGQMESCSHVLFSCVNAKSVWKKVGLWDLIKVASSQHCSDILAHISKATPCGNLERICVLMWCLWFDRNKVLHGGSPKDTSLVVSFADSFINGYRAVKLVPTKLGVNAQEPIIRWFPPSLNTIKMNLDAAIHPSRGGIGIGVIFRDHTGSVITTLSMKLNGLFSVEITELLAVQEVLRFAAIILVWILWKLMPCRSFKVYSRISSFQPLLISLMMSSPFLFQLIVVLVTLFLVQIIK